MYKLVAVDMDGTLLNSKGEISKKTVEVVKKIIDRGVVFTISTGRPIQGVKNYIELFDLNVPVITYNGGMIIQSKTNEILFQKELNKADARIIWELGKENNTTMCIWSGNQLYGNIINDRMNDYKKISGVEPLLVSDIDELLTNGVTKILWYDDVDKIKKWQAEYQLMGKEYTCCTSKPYFLEFFNKNVSKSVAMSKISEILNIGKEEMIAIGDGLNDLDMIEYAGMGVAMGNAAEEVKKIAQQITLSNDEDGVAVTLEKLILNA